MDDLSKKLEALLGDPESIGKIQAMMGALGASAPSAPASSPPEQPDASPDVSPAGLLDSLSGGLDISMLAKLAPLIGGLGGEGESDQHTILLKALRPYVQGDRVKKLDDAIHMMKLAKFLPLLQTLGGKEEPHGG